MKHLTNINTFVKNLLLWEKTGAQNIVKVNQSR